ncbi:MAG: hypothetical protein A2X28_07960 [Elusimicrobia bacterium GWA2_56_46]|nr:MAG: hypothetical protein A2X28_07960 [Elusimicrobia bacterium GWA2_56_46]OGR54309.1 MAG: hypothetical protein A2X39_03750 [Elusimicrobia bacterium GWC2_56_31]
MITDIDEFQLSRFLTRDLRTGTPGVRDTADLAKFHKPPPRSYLHITSGSRCYRLWCVKDTAEKRNEMKN